MRSSVARSSQKLVRRVVQLGSHTAEELLAAYEAKRGEVAESLARTLGGQCELSAGEIQEANVDALAAEFAGSGLAIVVRIEQAAALVVLSGLEKLLATNSQEATSDDDTRLAVITRDMGQLFVPDGTATPDCTYRRADNLPEMIQQAGLTDKSAYLRSTVSSGEQKGSLAFVWPINNPDDIVKVGNAESNDVSRSSRSSASQNDLGQRLKQLPKFTRSLLRIKVPVAVTLAETTQPLHRVLEFGPGSIIQFDKSCEEMLSLEVGNQKVAVGEAVKVGDKFGLRVTSMTMPMERFSSVKNQSEREASRKSAAPSTGTKSVDSAGTR